MMYQHSISSLYGTAGTNYNVIMQLDISAGNGHECGWDEKEVSWLVNQIRP